jgi:hypothetical protein
MTIQEILAQEGNEFNQLDFLALVPEDRAICKRFLIESIHHVLRLYRDGLVEGLPKERTECHCFRSYNCGCEKIDFNKCLTEVKEYILKSLE